jgi:hypothetical protein
MSLRSTISRLPSRRTVRAGSSGSTDNSDHGYLSYDAGPGPPPRVYRLAGNEDDAGNELPFLPQHDGDARWLQALVADRWPGSRLGRGQVRVRTAGSCRQSNTTGTTGVGPHVASTSTNGASTTASDWHKRFHFRAWWPRFPAFLNVVKHTWHYPLCDADQCCRLDWLFWNAAHFLKSWKDRFIWKCAHPAGGGKGCGPSP